MFFQIYDVLAARRLKLPYETDIISLCMLEILILELYALLSNSFFQYHCQSLERWDTRDISISIFKKKFTGDYLYSYNRNAIKTIKICNTNQEEDPPGVREMQRVQIEVSCFSGNYLKLKLVSSAADLNQEKIWISPLIWDQVWGFSFFLAIFLHWHVRMEKYFLPMSVLKRKI